jgi:hypothetical protein
MGTRRSYRRRDVRTLVPLTRRRTAKPSAAATPEGDEPHQRLLHAYDRTLRFSWLLGGQDTTVGFRLEEGRRRGDGRDAVADAHRLPGRDARQGRPGLLDTFWALSLDQPLQLTSHDSRVSGPPVQNGLVEKGMQRERRLAVQALLALHPHRDPAFDLLVWKSTWVHSPASPALTAPASPTSSTPSSSSASSPTSPCSTRRRRSVGSTVTVWATPATCSGTAMRPALTG